MGIHVGYHSWQRVAHDLGVRVEEQDVAPLAGSDALVVPAGVAQVHFAGDEVYLGEFAADHLHAAVCGGVVHDDDLKSASLQICKSVSLQICKY